MAAFPIPLEEEKSNRVKLPCSTFADMLLIGTMLFSLMPMKRVVERLEAAKELKTWTSKRCDDVSTSKNQML